MEKVLLKDEQKISKEEIAEKLVKISQGVKRGDLTLNSGEEQVSMEFSDTPEFEIKVEEVGSEMSLELEIEWDKNKERESGVEIS
jgi:amphi-Trp domain-containing protein